MNYEEFLRSKCQSNPNYGFRVEASEVNPAMFPHQKDTLRWSIMMGRAAAFLGTGMGKTFLELEWGRIVSKRDFGPVIHFAPLGVAQQTVYEEAPKYGIEARLVKKQSDIGSGINVTNYERLNDFDPSQFGAVFLDESSILKAMNGKTRTALIEAFGATPFRLCASATPAPNDYMELGNHAEFLGVMTVMEMLAVFFTHDGGDTQKWRLKGHARDAFWKWICTWAVSIRKPSDIGYSDDGFTLPPLAHEVHIVDINKPMDGMLFTRPAETLQERISARRDSVADRVEKCASIVTSVPSEEWIIWCNLNAEQEALTASFGDDCISIHGSLSAEEKLYRLNLWLSGERRILISKPSIFGFGLNFQHCRNMAFVGLNDSWEQFYQAVRRCWRFGQKRDVRVHLVAASTEGNVLDNLRRKGDEAEKMAQEISQAMGDLSLANLRGIDTTVPDYDAQMSMIIPAWIHSSIASEAL